MTNRAKIFSIRVSRPILACGADVKGAYALAKGSRIYVVEGFGDLQDLDNLSRYERSIRAHIRSLKIAPQVIACDLHPGYFSTRFAEGFQQSAFSHQLYRVQHHEAHIASGIVDHGLKGRLIGVAFDGTGYGLDGNIWGGEFFIGDLTRLERVGRLEYVPMPGGERVVSEPWRMAAAYLHRAFGDDFVKLKIDFVRRMNMKMWKLLKMMIDRHVQAPLTSSAGRLFDAAASLILSKDVVSREAEGPRALEEIADESLNDSYEYSIRKERDKLVVKPSGIVRGLVKDLLKDAKASLLAAKLHNTVAEFIVSLCMVLRRRYRLNRVLLSGGVFQNGFLLNRVNERLADKGFDAYGPSRVPVNDYGIPVGQVAIANARCGSRGAGSR